MLEAREINILEVFKKREQLQKQYQAEAECVQEKYAPILEEYKPAQEKMNSEIQAFKDNWDAQMAPYRKEMKALKKKVQRNAEGTLIHVDYPPR